MSNRKAPQDWSPTYLQRQSQAWCKVHKERVRSIIRQERLKNPAKLIYMGLLTYLHDGGGLLLEPQDRIAVSLGYTKEEFADCVEKLIKGGWIAVAASGRLFEPTVYKCITGNEHPDDVQIPQDSASFAKIGEKMQNSLGQTSPLDKIRDFSISDASNAASDNRKIDSLFVHQISENEDLKNREGSLKVASLFSALKIEMMEELRALHNDLDWSDLCDKFAEANKTTARKRINREWFENFVSMYRRKQGNAADSTKPQKAVSQEDEAVRLARLPKLGERYIKVKEMRSRITSTGLVYEDEVEVEKEIYTIGEKDITHKNFGIDQVDFLRLVRNMPDKPKAEAHKYLCGLVGKEWNTQTALGDEDKGLVFAWGDNDELWRGMDYQTADERALEEERMRLAAEEQARKAEAAKAAHAAKEEAEKHLAKVIRDAVDLIQGSWLLESEEHVIAALRESFVGLKFLRGEFVETFSSLADYSEDGAREAADKLSKVVDWEMSPEEETRKLKERHLAALQEKTIENGCTEGEAVAAAEKVVELKAKYGIEAAA